MKDGGAGKHHKASMCSLIAVRSGGLELSSAPAPAPAPALRGEVHGRLVVLRKPS